MSKVLFISSEASPLIKTGGLADVSGSLPVALQKQRLSVRLLLPAYPAAIKLAAAHKIIATLQIKGVPGEVKLLEGKLPGTTLPVWLVDYEPAFNRKGNPYVQSDGSEWPDNAERFTLLSRCAVEIAQGRAGITWKPDIVHCNDWQTGLVPALLSLEASRPATIFTIHNLSYQGLFPRSTYISLGLPPSLWSFEGLEFHGQLSFIKGGLAYADQITTVSPEYAKEIQTPRFGDGLEGLLAFRNNELTGILNGINETEWDPKRDPYIVKNYTTETFREKAKNKQDLLKTFGLPIKDNTLLLGSVGRLVEQKGIDLILDIFRRMALLPIQFILLGTGDKHYEKALLKAAKRYPNTISVNIGYNESLAHKIEAGADAFLMPSRFEPCGLNQLYSLRYGTVPIVHAVGGLKDTIVDSTGKSLKEGLATGFTFNKPDPEELLKTIERALKLYEKPAQWRRVAKTAMKQCFNWQESARRYAKLYRACIKAKSTK